MKLTTQCDGCGIVGSSEKFGSDGTGRDLCAKCERAEKLADMKRDAAKLKEWMEVTHLEKLRRMETEIAELEKEEGA